uniref:DNA topoisomerase (ATP-hydrolyzing) n=1 Tax=viral metagenome TaxID=1070528 RepID=A0A6C0IJW1_9ZZZZ
MSASKENQILTDKYQQKTDKQHILDNPDTYIGSVEKVDSEVWLLNEDDSKIIEKNISYIPGLFKLFDEGIVNCRDHVVRMAQAVANGQENALPVTNIDITIDPDGTITMTNDGNGIDVAEHPEYKIWIPELIFGHLRTSTNYNKDEKKIVGGKNGFGFKLVLIWSTYGSIETVDHVRGLKYRQEFNNNLDEICKPSITKCKTKPYTKITFKPDYKRLGIAGLTPDLIALLKKRVYDVGAVTDKNLKVKYNSALVPVKNFQQYIDLYIGDKSAAPRVYEDAGDRWEYAVALTPSNEFIQISFVNGIHTAKGGKHVEYILNQITRKLVDFIEKKKKVKVNPNSIKEQIMLFIRCDIENPAFDSQTKDFMNTPSSKFGSKCEVSDKFIEKVAKMGVMDAACAITEVKENKAAKKTDGIKSKTIRGIPKLTDANWAGTEKSCDTTIIFCEGDSAKAGIISGLSSEDRNTIGVYPMKGKIMNVRGESVKRVAENKEIAEIKKILGLETGKEYKNMEDVSKSLRYGRVLFMTDQDLDGSHIKGLGINLFQTEWPSLAEIPGFIGFMNTPILKARKGTQELMFYNEGEYETWKQANNTKGWNIKYYKGLGTSTGKEFKEYFQHKKFVGFEHNGKTSDDAIDMVFNKKRADDRKDWLEDYDRESYLNTTHKNVSYEDFINKELIHFSKYDCDRSIPNLMDGLKISQRKIIFAAFKKNLTTEIKVAQFSGYVSENSCYHHGEASLNQAIKGMAQNFVGANNINLLFPSGQFGTRIQGGDDAASERYIFTRLEKITRTIFPAADDNILKYLNDDGTPVEPLFYAPIIPMILVNGSKGIGTGFSTDIMCYNPLQIIEYLNCKLSAKIGAKLQIVYDEDFIPHYDGFQGTIEKINDSKFLIKGKYEKVGTDKIRVTELPVGFWTENFKEHLEYLIEPGQDKDGKKINAFIKDYDDMSRDTIIDFTVTFPKGKIEELEATIADHNCNGLEKLLKLYTTNTNTNMHLFDAEDKLKKYNKVEEIIDDYFETRLKMYEVRKAYVINSLERELLLLSNKAKYIKENLDGTIDLRKKKKEQVIQMLQEKGYAIIDDDDEYKYLVKLPMDCVTEENVEKIFNEHGTKMTELEYTKKKEPAQIWSEELVVLKDIYGTFLEERLRMMMGDDEKPKKKKISNVKKGSKNIVIDA